MNPLIRASVQRMCPYVPGEQPAGDGMIKLNTNENPYPPSPRVAARLRDFDAERLRLYPDPQCAALRAAIGALHAIAPEQVLVGNGSDELLLLCVRAFVERGAGVGYFDPSYSLYPVLAASEEVPVRPTPLGSDFTWKPPQVRAVALFFLTCPNAPTGMLYPAGEIEAFCSAFQGVVVVDEAYVDFAGHDALDLARRLPNVLVLRTLSKGYSLAGLRLGYLLGAPELVQALYTIKDSYNVSRLAQELGLAALQDQETLRANTRRIIHTREASAAALRERGFTVCPSHANFLWVRPPAAASAERLWSELRRRRILLRHFPGAHTGDFLRITVGSDPQMQSLMQAVDELLGTA